MNPQQTHNERAMNPQQTRNEPAINSQQTHNEPAITCYTPQLSTAFPSSFPLFPYVPKIKTFILRKWRCHRYLLPVKQAVKM